MRRTPPGNERTIKMSDNPVFDRIRQEVDQNQVVLYMKGTPIFPQCGFSALWSKS